MKNKIFVVCFIAIHFLATGLIMLSQESEEEVMFNEHTNLIDTNSDSVISESELTEYKRKPPPNYEEIFNQLHTKQVEEITSSSSIKVVFALIWLSGIIYFSASEIASKVYLVFGIVSIPISPLLAIEMALMSCTLLIAGLFEKRKSLMKRS